MSSVCEPVARGSDGVPPRRGAGDGHACVRRPVDHGRGADPVGCGATGPGVSTWGAPHPSLVPRRGNLNSVPGPGGPARGLRGWRARDADRPGADRLPATRRSDSLVRTRPTAGGGPGDRGRPPCARGRRRPGPRPARRTRPGAQGRQRRGRRARRRDRPGAPRRASPGRRGHRHRDAWHERPGDASHDPRAGAVDAGRRHDRARLGRLRRLGAARAGRRVPHEAPGQRAPRADRRPARPGGPREARAPRPARPSSPSARTPTTSRSGSAASSPGTARRATASPSSRCRAEHAAVRRTVASTSLSPRPSCSGRGCSSRTSWTPRSSAPDPPCVSWRRS